MGALEDRKKKVLLELKMALERESKKAGEQMGSYAWTLIQETTGGMLGECHDNPVASPTLKKTADGKALAYMQAVPINTNAALAPCTLVSFLCGCSKTLALPGGKKITIAGKFDFVVVVSGWAGGDADVEILEAALKGIKLDP